MQPHHPAAVPGPERVLLYYNTRGLVGNPWRAGVVDWEAADQPGRLGRPERMKNWIVVDILSTGNPWHGCIFENGGKSWYMMTGQ
ncbi:hypothetical protein CLAIMM_05389 [Cladophialophora immunda]|nr:hypothetical protein CLAIMM_05389 [Cladophialophora immunda]